MINRFLVHCVQKRSNEQDNLKSHKERRHGSIPHYTNKAFECSECCKFYLTTMYLNIHKLKKHGYTIQPGE